MAERLATRLKRREVLRLLAVGGAGVGLAACGFQPMYGHYRDRTPVAAQLAMISIDPIPDRTGQLVRNALEQRMARGGTAAQRYRLAVDLAEATAGVGIQMNALASLANLTMTATFTLTGGDIGQWTGRSSAVVSYALLGEPYASKAAEADARARAAEMLADDMVLKIGAFLNRRTPGPG